MGLTLVLLNSPVMGFCQISDIWYERLAIEQVSDPIGNQLIDPTHNQLQLLGEWAPHLARVTH